MSGNGSPASVGRTLLYAPWHFLYFFPLPHQQGSLRPILLDCTWRRTGAALFARALPFWRAPPVIGLRLVPSRPSLLA